MIYAFILALVFTHAYANNTELFGTAVEQYEQGDYSGSLHTYEQIHPKNGAVWHNMAYAAQQTNDVIHAQLYHLRAQKSFFSPLAIQILFFCLFSVFFISVARYRVRKKYSIVCLVSVITLASGAFTYHTYRQQKNSYGLIMADQTLAYIGPGTMYHPLEQINQGTRVLIFCQNDGWNKVAWDNKIGWIPSTQVETI